MNGAVQWILADTGRTHGPFHRVLGLADADVRLDVIFRSAFAVGDDGPPRIVGGVASPGKVGQEEESKQAAGGGFNVGNGDGYAGQQAFVGDRGCVDLNRRRRRPVHVCIAVAGAAALCVKRPRTHAVGVGRAHGGQHEEHGDHHQHSDALHGRSPPRWPRTGRTSNASTSNTPKPMPRLVEGPGSSGGAGLNTGLMESLAPR